MQHEPLRSEENKQQLAFQFWQQTIRAGQEAPAMRAESQQEKPVQTDRRQPQP